VAEGTGIEVVKIPPSSPNLNPICERFIGSVRRECLNHAIVLNERHLHRVLWEYVETYFNRARPHQGLFLNIPDGAARRLVSSPRSKVVALPILGGLHHGYQWAA
jgi:putative transposase